uniref:Uncharacterized protein n=1 Tax=Anguilla anguilla TaxID=7936 RepID=A0A0E9V002_ANGAN
MTGLSTPPNSYSCNPHCRLVGYQCNVTEL